MTDLAQSNDEEFRLAHQMKNDFCDGSGKEKYPAKAAEIVHKIGLTYRKRSPDKIGLIQSVGLFNAAILRNPSNIAQIKFDLIEICQHILQIAEAKHQNVSLIKKAEEVKAQFENLRTEMKFSLKESLPNISVKHGDTNDVYELISHKISTTYIFWKFTITLMLIVIVFFFLYTIVFLIPLGTSARSTLLSNLEKICHLWQFRYSISSSGCFFSLLSTTF